MTLKEEARKSGELGAKFSGAARNGALLSDEAATMQDTNSWILVFII